MPLYVPLEPIPNQQVTVLLNGQNCQINVYQKALGLFLDLIVSNNLLLAGQICEDRNLIVRSAYLSFLGDIGFIDTQGTENPNYQGLGVRFFLAYLFPDELPPGVN